MSNQLGKMVVRIFGIAGHGKGEIDSCGGHMKNPVREAINMSTDKYIGLEGGRGSKLKCLPHQ